MNSPLLFVAAILLGLLLLAFVLIKIFDTFLQKRPPQSKDCPGCSARDCASCQTFIEIQALPSQDSQDSKKQTP